jgi:hypothetical protein
MSGSDRRRLDILMFMSGSEPSRVSERSGQVRPTDVKACSRHDDSDPGNRREESHLVTG